MAIASDDIQSYVEQEYKYGFVTDIDVDEVPPGLNEAIIRTISAKKKEPERFVQFRLKA